MSTKILKPQTKLVLPPFYKPENADEIYDPSQWANDMLTLSAEYRKAYGVSDSQLDIAKQVILALIDDQIGFCSKRFGSLYVAGQNDPALESDSGAVDDSRRTAEFIYSYGDWIDQIATTFDTHFIEQIFHSLFLIDGDGNHPGPNTVITVESLKKGEWQVDPRIAGMLAEGKWAWLKDYAIHYAQQLLNDGRYPWMNWIFHTLLGSIGHALQPIIFEAVLWHCFIKRYRFMPQLKGMFPLTEQYDAMTVEVATAHDGTAVGQDNVRFIEMLIKCGVLVIGGQARSHCVNYFIRTLRNKIRAIDPALLQKIYIVEDLTSNVVIYGPNGERLADFTAEGNAALDDYRNSGMNVVRSTTPIWEWPGFLERVSRLAA